MKSDKLPRIFEKERLAFLRLWHGYHARYKIPYSHDEAQYMFEKLLEIFNDPFNNPAD